MRFELFIASRYLRAKRRQAVIGVITIISILGVAAGVASLIIALAINNGFSQDLQARLLGSMAHVQLMRVQNDGIRDWQSLSQRLATQPHVIADAPAIYEQVLVSRGARGAGAILKGIIPSEERKISDLLNTVKFGSADALDELGKGPGNAYGVGGSADTRNSMKDLGAPHPSSIDDMRAVTHRVMAMPPILLGKDLADQLGATVGSVVLVTSPQKELTPLGVIPGFTRFRVAGIFSSGFYDYDVSWAFIRLKDAQSLFGLGDIATVIEFKIDDIYQAADVGKQLSNAAGQGFMTTNWMEQNRALFRALRLERVVTYITIGLIVFVAALNILISLIMMVMEKTRDIAVLMSMGARKRQVRSIFIAQGLLVGIVGTIVGLVVGYLLSWAGGHYHLISLSAEVYSIDYVPFAPRVIDGILVSLISLGVSFIATIYPSTSAARVLPAEALRYE